MPKRQNTTKKNTQTDDTDRGISTDIALGCDGHLYASGEILSKEERKGRKVFVGYRLTPREQAAATVEAHRMMAFNLRAPIRQAMREEQAKPKRPR